MAEADFYIFSLGVSGTVSLQFTRFNANNMGKRANNLAFVANNVVGSGVGIVDMTNTASPQILGTVNLGGVGRGVVTDGSYAYLATTAMSGICHRRPRVVAPPVI